MSPDGLHHSWSRRPTCFTLLPVKIVNLEKGFTGGWIKSGNDRMRDVSREQWIMRENRPFDSSPKECVCEAITKLDLPIGWVHCTFQLRFFSRVDVDSYTSKSRACASRVLVKKVTIPCVCIKIKAWGWHSHRHTMVNIYSRKHCQKW